MCGIVAYVVGRPAVDMLRQVHRDALWVLENMGVGCAHVVLAEAFRKHEPDGRVILYENRIYITADLVAECLNRVPGLSSFFVPRNRFFIGGRAPYVYDDAAGKVRVRILQRARFDVACQDMPAAVIVEVVFNPS